MYADVITKFSGIDRFLYSIPSHDGYGAPLRARTPRYEVIQELQVMSGAYHPGDRLLVILTFCSELNAQLKKNEFKQNGRFEYKKIEDKVAPIKRTTSA